MSTFWTPDRSKSGLALVRSGNTWLEFRDPIETRTATTLSEVLPLIEWAELESKTRFAVGFVSFDAAPAFDQFSVVSGSAVPLARFATYDQFEPFQYLTLGGLGFYDPSLSAELTRENYLVQIEQIKAMLHAGRTYQVNLTYRMQGEIQGDPADMFCGLCEAHIPEYGAMLVYDDLAILSMSPELFFRRDGDIVTCQPMKGTRPLDGDPEELRGSEKDRAENLMIVDMIRNDLGRIADTGSVSVPSLFDVSEHGTVLQMTSTVEARTSASTVEIFKAMFPCASVVGAPKVETMKVISELEKSPRGVYCGAIGVMSPGHTASFNVAIRTLVIKGHEAQYGVGSGVVWDSVAAEEWEECKVKAKALEAVNDYCLLETGLWDAVSLGSFAFSDLHRQRMLQAAGDLGFRFAQNMWTCPDFGEESKIVRVLGEQDGLIRFEDRPLVEWRKPIVAALCPWPVYSKAMKLRYKTTRRGVYERARAEFPDLDEVLLWNELGEVTEFTTGSLVVELGRELYTPPTRCGLLPGIFVRYRGIEERVITLTDLRAARAVFHANSVRGLTEVELRW